MGETGRLFTHRINQHISCIRLKKQTPIGLHFNIADHLLKHFSIMGINKIADTSNNHAIRLNKESTWQTILQTNYPYGINNLNSSLLQ